MTGKMATIKIKPEIARPEIPDIPAAETAKLDNGIPVYLIESGTEELIRVDLTFPAGQLYEDRPLLASSVNGMLTEGTSNFSSRKINSLIDYYGAFCSPYCEKDQAGMVIFLINKHLQNILPLASEMLAKPAFRPRELKTFLNKRMRWLLINREKISFKSSELFLESVFGKTHPYGRIPQLNDYRNITSEMAGEYHRSKYVPGDMAIIISGRLPGNLLQGLNDHFGTLDCRYKGKKATSIMVTEPEKERNIYVPVSRSVQSSLRIGSPAIDIKHPDFSALKITDMILGGYFGSRLMKNIREDKGLTYGIGSSVTSLRAGGFKVISTEVDKSKRQYAINEIKKEIIKLQEKKVEMNELNMVRNYMLGELLRTFDGPFAIAEAFRNVWESGLDNDFYKMFAEKIKTIAPDEILRIAQTYYNIDELYFISVG